MAPFIKYTEKVVGKAATTTYLRYVNAACVQQARYDAGNKKLWLTVDGRDIELNGEEAEQAIEVLQKL